MAVTPGYPRRYVRNASSSVGWNGWVTCGNTHLLGGWGGEQPGADQEIVTALDEPTPQSHGSLGKSHRYRIRVHPPTATSVNIPIASGM